MRASRNAWSGSRRRSASASVIRLFQLIADRRPWSYAGRVARSSGAPSELVASIRKRSECRASRGRRMPFGRGRADRLRVRAIVVIVGRDVLRRAVQHGADDVQVLYELFDRREIGLLRRSLGEHQQDGVDQRAEREHVVGREKRRQIEHDDAALPLTELIDEQVHLRGRQELRRVRERTLVQQESEALYPGIEQRALELDGALQDVTDAVTGINAEITRDRGLAQIE